MDRRECTETHMCYPEAWFRTLRPSQFSPLGVLEVASASAFRVYVTRESVIIKTCEHKLQKLKSTHTVEVWLDPFN